MNELKRLKELLLLFEEHYVCESCEKMAATYVINCKNPLHRLHDYVYELDRANG